MLQIPDDQLKKMLIDEGIVTDKQFISAQVEAKRMERNLADILISQELLTNDYYFGLVAKFYGVEKVNLSTKKIDEAAVKLLPEKIARDKQVIIFNKRPDGSFDVAMEDPTNLQTIEFLNKFLGGKINPYLVQQGDLSRGFVYYGRESAQEFKQLIVDNIQKSLRSKVAGIKEAATDLPVVAIVDNLIAYAISLRASDIHIEILEDGMLVRFRIDGVLQEIVRVAKDVDPAIVARIKLLAGLKLDEHTKPQDGRFRYKIAKSAMDIRVAIMPTFYGEKVEMRILSATEKPLSLEELGLSDDHIKVARDNLKKSYGMILVTGPTGSGKTTTLYSLMSILNRPEINIVTIEDPIEYDMKYINQTQINLAAGITFASGLREIVRQDPNVVMVGEIRDRETAQIAIQAALTGHLLLSSLHTNDAPTAIPRLLDLGVPAFLIAASTNLVEAQRLVRKICPECIVSYKPDQSVIEVIKKQVADLKLENVRIPTTLYKGTGCATCNHSGYKGRVGIFELLNINEEVRQLIVEKSFTLDALRALARKQGMITMFEDGLLKVERGITTIEELLRVIRD